MGVTVRTMRVDEIHLAIDWAAAEGWNPGLHDAECFFAADRNGFFLAEVDGVPVGCISAVRYEDQFGFLGLYIVLPGHRGKGYGLKLWNAGMDYLSGRIVGLDGVVAQQENYKKSGFVLAHRNVRYELKSSADPSNSAGPALTGDCELVEIGAVPLDMLNAYDRDLFGFQRQLFLRAWITRPGTVGLGLMADGRLVGYVVARPCRTGYKIAPLFADSNVEAELLLHGILKRVRSGPVFLDVPEPSQLAVKLAQRYGGEPMFETARMYAGGDPGLPLERIFGITSFELG